VADFNSDKCMYNSIVFTSTSHQVSDEIVDRFQGKDKDLVQSHDFIQY